MERKMIMTSKILLRSLVILLSSAAFGQIVHQDPSPVVQPVKKSQTAPLAQQQHEDEGSRVFQQNCSRCHNTPEGFSPRISGTISRHMRVRASLSKHDEEELLRFLNP
jgi:cytochrome c5